MRYVEKIKGDLSDVERDSYYCIIAKRRMVQTLIVLAMFFVLIYPCHFVFAKEILYIPWAWERNNTRQNSRVHLVFVLLVQFHFESSIRHIGYAYPYHIRTCIMMQMWAYILNNSREWIQSISVVNLILDNKAQIQVASNHNFSCTVQPLRTPREYSSDSAYSKLLF